MLKGVDGNDNIGTLRCRRCEEAGIVNACIERLLPGCLQGVLTNIDTGHALGPFLSDLNGL